MSKIAKLSNDLRKKIRRFQSDEKGAVAIIFGLSAISAVMVMGAAIDYSRAVSAKTTLQTAVDEAALLAARTPKTSRVQVAVERIKSALTNTGITFQDCVCNTMPDGSFQAVVKATVPSTALQLASIQTLNLSATSVADTRVAAQLTPTNVTVKLDRAQGWSWKRVTLWKTIGTTDTLLGTWVYQPTYRTRSPEGYDSGAWVGIGTLSGPTDAINIGSDYNNLYLKMEVWSDSCGPNLKNSSSSLSDKVNCAPGTKSSTAKFGQYSTNDPNAANRLFINGVQLTPSKVATIFQIIPCGATNKQSWEDTFNAPGDKEWQMQDIFFTVTANACASNVNFQYPTTFLKK